VTPGKSDAYYTLLPFMEQVGSADGVRFVHDTFKVVPPMNTAAYIDIFAERQVFAKEWRKLQAHYPLIIAPVSAQQLFPVGFDLGGSANIEELFSANRLLGLINFLGLPSLALPVGMGSHLPQSVQLIAPNYREDLCLAAGQIIEDRLGILTPLDPRW